MKFIAETNNNIATDTTSFTLNIAVDSVPREKYLEFMNAVVAAMKNMLPTEAETNSNLVKQVLDLTAKNGTFGSAKISYIKSYRAITGRDLRDSLAWVEENMKGYYND